MMSRAQRRLWRILERIPAIIVEEIAAHAVMILVALIIALILLMFASS